jgi:hypothetical protein
MPINTPISDKLYQLIGSPPSSIESFIPSTPTITTVSDYTYYAYKPLGLSFCFITNVDQELKLDAIDVYNGQTRDGFSTCTLTDLPCGINQDMQAHAIVSLLGEPDRKGGGGQSRLPCWIEYKFNGEHDSGILIQLHGFEWEDREMGWTSFVLF